MPLVVRFTYWPQPVVMLGWFSLYCLLKKKKAKCCSHFQVWVLLCEQAGYFYWCIFSVLIQKLRPVMVLLPLCIAEYYHGGWMVK